MPPKSLDRNAFHASAVAGLSLQDAAATLVAFTTEGILSALSLVPQQPEKSIVLCGGGASAIRRCSRPFARGRPVP